MNASAVRCGANRVEYVDGVLTRVHEPERADPADQPWHSSALRAGTEPITGADSWDWTPNVTHRLIQQAESCVGHATRASIMLNATIIGKQSDVPSVSALMPYTGSRLYDAKGVPRGPTDPILLDWGCTVRYSIKASRDMGVVREEIWPEDADKINVVPDLNAFERAEGVQVKGFNRLSQQTDVTLPELKEAGKRGLCPIACMVVDDKFRNIGKEVLTGNGGAVLGGHAMVVIGYSAILKAFKMLNWWGPDLGDDGYWWIAEEFAQRVFYDIWAVELLTTEIS